MKFYHNAMREYGAAAQRSVVMGPRGAVASSQHLASLAGQRTLARGGNAVDAAVAMMACLNVVEPHMGGIGGDAFALIYLAAENKMVGLNASGRAPAAATMDWYRSQGYEQMPATGILAVTTPGALMGWAQAVERYGKLSLAEIFEDAIYYAENGFPVTEVIAGEWASAAELLAAHENSASTYLPSGKPPRPGQICRNPDLGRTFRRIAEQGCQTFYSGELAGEIAEFCRRQGGLLSINDLAMHTCTWTLPLTRDYRGYTVAELPPNGQGVTALEMLNILEGFDLASLEHNSPAHLHLLIEAAKLAFADRDAFITDPVFEDIPVKNMLAPEYGQACREKISPDRAMEPPPPGAGASGSNTFYVAAGDDEGNAASFICSLYSFFGSGLVVDGSGIMLQCRGRSFSLDPEHPNHLEPGKRPLHTLIPGMLLKDGRFQMAFGIMGADVQPQAHVQFLSNLIDFGMNLQEALDVPRVFRAADKQVHFEGGFPQETINTLVAMGHEKDSSPAMRNWVGGGQAVYRDHAHGIWLAASDRRKDGAAVGW